ncbi:hypothetical protein SY88_00650 [Clostridiales bacterium PH28_bin88]|nr:hypothetical protein SY88_00650 [Clostridiales bacterium PH28_bin88]
MDKAEVNLHRRAVVVDAHCDTLIKMQVEGRSLVTRSSTGHVDLPRLREGGVDVQFFAAYIAPEYKPARALKRALQIIDLFYHQLSANQGKIMLVEKYSDIERCLHHNMLGAILSIEGGEAIEEDVGVLRMLFRLGVRSMCLTWNHRNALADGVGEEANGGLTRLGIAVVQEMNRLGMLIDVAHMAERSFYNVLENSTHPLIASHANCMGLYEHPRNLRDEQIKALAEKGGVIGITFCPSFVSDSTPSLSKVVDHIDYASNLVGPRYVGLGSDFDGIDSTPTGLEDATCWPRITEELLSRGYKNDEIEGILGGNHLRVLKEVLAP